MFAAFIFGILLIWGFKKSPAFMVYSMCVIKVLTPAAAGVAYLAMGATYDVANGDAGTIHVPGYVLIGLSFLLAVVLYCYRSQLRLVVRLFRESAIGVQENVAIIPVSAFLVFLSSFVWVMFLSGAVWKILHGRFVPPVAGGGDMCVWTLSNDATVRPLLHPHVPIVRLLPPYAPFCTHPHVPIVRLLVSVPQVCSPIKLPCNVGNFVQTCEVMRNIIRSQAFMIFGSIALVAAHTAMHYPYYVYFL